MLTNKQAWMCYPVSLDKDDISDCHSSCNRIRAFGCGEMINENSYNAITSSSLKVIIILNKILNETLQN